MHVALFLPWHPHAVALFIRFRKFESLSVFMYRAEFYDPPLIA